MSEWHDKLAKRLHDHDGPMDASLRFDLQECIAECRMLWAERLSERRRAWDEYAAAFPTHFVGNDAAPFGAKWADLMLAERDKRFPTR